MLSTYRVKLLVLLLVCLIAALCHPNRFLAEDHDEHEDEHEHEHEDEESISSLTTAQVWGFGILAGIAVSLIGFLAAIMLLCSKKCCSPQIFEWILKFLFALACGALLGDAIIHILGQAYPNPDLDSLAISGIFIGSLLGFIILEKIFESLGVSHSHWVGENLQEKQVHPSQGNIVEAEGEAETIAEERSVKMWLKQFGGKGSAGYINLIGSLIHNFIDGLALGIAFATGQPNTIVPVLIAIVTHEIPRQLGDVAILLKNEFNEIQTVICNGTINLVSLVGLIIGIGLGSINQVVKNYIMVFVAANFIYIAADIWRHIFKNRGEKALRKNVMQFVGFGIGVGVMFSLTLLESEEEGHHH